MATAASVSALQRRS